MRIEKLLSRIVSGLTWMVTALMAAMAGILIVNVACRYVFGFSLTWSAEAARYCMVWVAFLGIAVLVYHREHLSVNLLGSRLGPRWHKVLRGVILSGSAMFFVIQSVFGAVLVAQTYGQTAASITWLPMNVVYAVIPLSGIIMTLSATCEIVRLIKHEGGDA